jgi:hypothetical protein
MKLILNLEYHSTSFQFKYEILATTKGKSIDAFSSWLRVAATKNSLSSITISFYGSTYTCKFESKIGDE